MNRVARSAVGIAFLAVCCAREEEPPQVPRDVLLITLDTARADRFSYTGAPGPGTPRVDALAATGAGFLDAISPVPITLPAHASLLTGRLPQSHTVRDNGTYRLPESETTLAEVLAGAGYATGAFIGAQVLDSRYGLDQGFATYDDEIQDDGGSPFRFYAERKGEDVVAAASRWLDNQGERPTFAWVHLFDPHAPYRPPEPERSRYPSPYDGEIAHVDRVLGQLLDHWQARGRLDRALVVVTSDHGEGLGEHGEPTHGVLVHEATLRVPLVIRAPGYVAPGRVAAPVSLIDVLPTVLGLMGLPVPEGVQGRDLRPLLSGQAVDGSPESGYSESLYARFHHACAPLVSLREDGWKLVKGSQTELYDLRSDPGEARDVALANPERRDRLLEALAEVAAKTEGVPAERLALDESTRRALESLGYLGSGPAGEPRGGFVRDPREALVSLHEMAQADRGAAGGDLDDAIARYRKVIAREPSGVDARFRLASILRSKNRGSDAAKLLAEALAINPGEPFLYVTLGDVLYELGRVEESLATYDAGIERHPGDRRLRDGRWRSLNRLNRQDVLRVEAERAVAMNPKDGAARYARALACCGRGAVGPYIDALERELAELPGDPILVKALRDARAEK